MKPIYLTILMTFLTQLPGHSQGLITPPEGKAVVHFVIDTSAEAKDSVLLFHGEYYLGEYRKSDQTHVIIEPGTHLFWGWRKQSVWLEAEVAANKTYIVLIDETPDTDGLPIEFTPVRDGTARYRRVLKVIGQNSPVKAGREIISEFPGYIEELITSSMQEYAGHTVNGSRISRLSADMEVGKLPFKVPPISH